jgi:hypothetical protein
MQHLDLDDEEAGVLVALLMRTITDDRYPLSPRRDPLKAILAKLEPAKLQPAPSSLPKSYAPPASNSRQEAPSMARSR